MTQNEALTILKSGGNVFLTGEPGSGKSHTINAFVAYLREHDIEPAITASTGIAATHIGGMTIHSWSGIGIRKSLTEQDLDNLSSNERLVKRVSRTQVLIIDEISMLDALTLSAVDAACRTLRRRPSDAFGGMQVVLVGDFFQLPPVSRRGEDRPQFAYRSNAWRAAKPLVCYLHEQYRQEDGHFLRFLSSLRSGNVGDDAHDILEACRADETSDDIEGLTRLYTHNIDVDKINDTKLHAIEDEEHIFDMHSRGSEGLVAQLKKSCLSPESLRLKTGAKVMFTKNSFEQGFVNGTLGEIVGFAVGAGPIVLTKDGRRIEVQTAEWSIVDGTKTLATIIQYPLRLAWAITIHKSQGMTLDSALIDLSEAFEYGQGYVALSRVKTLSSLRLFGYNKRALEVHPEIIAIDADFRAQSIDAEEVFRNLSEEEKMEMQMNFIRACGGKIDKVEVKKKKAAKSEKLAKTRAAKAKGETTFDTTFGMWKEGKSIEAIAAERQMTRGTIVGHVEELFMTGKIERNDLERVALATLRDGLPEVLKVCKIMKDQKLAPIFFKLGKQYSYEDIRLARLLV